MNAQAPNRDFPDVDDLKDVQFLHSLASGQLMFGNIEQAYNLLSLALFVQPLNAETLHRMIKVELDIGHVSRALMRFSDLRKARAPQRLSHEDRRLFARALLKAGKIDRWRQALRELNAQADGAAGPTNRNAPDGDPLS